MAKYCVNQHFKTVRFPPNLRFLLKNSPATVNINLVLFPLFALARAEFYNRVFSIVLADTYVSIICIFEDFSREADFLQSKCDHKFCTHRVQKSIPFPDTADKTLERYAVVKVRF